MKAPREVLQRGTDYAAGWEVGRNKGRERIGGRLFDRLPPYHLANTPRADQWRLGYRDGLAERPKQSTRYLVSYTDKDGGEARKEMTGSRRSIVDRLARAGVCGDVYLSSATRSYTAGI